MKALNNFSKANIIEVHLAIWVHPDRPAMVNHSINTQKNYFERTPAEFGEDIKIFLNLAKTQFVLPFSLKYLANREGLTLKHGRYICLDDKVLQNMALFDFLWIPIMSLNHQHQDTRYSNPNRDTV